MTASAMKKLALQNACESMFKFVTRKSKEVVTENSDRSREPGESYGSGWRNTTHTHTFQHGPYLAEAVRIEGVYWNPSSDSTSTRYQLFIRRGEKIIFRAFRSGEGKVNRFTGSDERFAGSNNVDAKSWEFQGKLPSVYQKQFLKPAQAARARKR